jgi:F0F1-type ATP synthase membrane subunit b/b'
MIYTGEEVSHESELFEVMFGLEHVVAEFFWNAVFAVALLAISKSRVLKKIHKYIDEKHEVTHDKY